MAKLSHTDEEFKRLIKHHSAKPSSSSTNPGTKQLMQFGLTLLLLIATFTENIVVGKLIEVSELQEKEAHLVYRLVYTALLVILFWFVLSTETPASKKNSQPAFSEALLFPAEIIEHSFLIIRFYSLLNDMKWSSICVGPTLLAYLSSVQSIEAMSLRGVTQEAAGIPPEALLPFIILCELANLYFMFNDSTLFQGSFLRQDFPVDLPLNEDIGNFFSSFPRLFVDDDIHFAADHIDLTWGGAFALLLTFLGLNNGVYQLLACIKDLIFGEKHPFEDNANHFGDGKYRLFVNIVANLLYIGLGIGAILSLKVMEVDFRRQSAYAALYGCLIFLSLEACIKLKLLKLTGIQSLPLPLTIFVLWMFLICANQDFELTKELGKNLMPVNWYTAFGSAVVLNSLRQVTGVSSEVKAVFVRG